MPCTEAYNISCIRSMAVARPSYALQHSTYGVTGADGGKKKYPLNTLQKKSFPVYGCLMDEEAAPCRASFLRRWKPRQTLKRL